MIAFKCDCIRKPTIQKMNCPQWHSGQNHKVAMKWRIFSSELWCTSKCNRLLKSIMASGIPCSHNTPDYWSPAVINQHSFKYTLLSVSHRPVYRSPTRTKPDSPLLLTCLYLPSVFSSNPFLPHSRSIPLNLQKRLHYPSPITAMHQETDICVRTVFHLHLWK